jgi:mono/diheme cytochrome c family protein
MSLTNLRFAKRINHQSLINFQFSADLSKMSTNQYKSAISVFILLLSACAILLAQESPRTVWDGVYNQTQSQRGQALFLEHCSSCHGRDLEGLDMTPPLTGGAFTANWDGLTLGDLADRIRVSMPLNAPGTLSRQDTADIVAYILRFNEFPAGKDELSREVPVMKQILFKAMKP